MHLRRALLLLPLIGSLLIASAAAHAQEIDLQALPAPSPSPSPTIDPATEQKALDLLESISDQAANLHSSTNRIRASSSIADLLWTRDEKRARSLFTAAVNQLAARLGEIDFEDTEAYQEISRIQQLRQELIMRIATRDADMAINALYQTRLPADVNQAYGSNQNEVMFELNLANIIAGKNPAAALKLARAGLANGVSWNAVSFLLQIYEKDPKSAQTFFGEIVARIKQENL